MTHTRRGLGRGMGMGYKNLVHNDRWVHAMSAKGVRSYIFSSPIRRQTAYDIVQVDYGVQKQKMKLIPIKSDEKGTKRFVIEWEIGDGLDYEEIGIWIKGNKVTEYDGVFELPEQAIKLLKQNGYDTSKVDLSDYKSKKLDARGNMNLLRLDPEYTVTTYSESTRNGFRHVAILFRNGYEVNKATANYLNRTWESYDFQTVLHKLLDKSFDKDKAKSLKEKIDTSRGRSLMAKYTHKTSRGEVEANVKAIPLGTAILYKTKSVSKDALLGEIKNLAGKFDMNEYARAYYNEFNSSFVLYGNRGLKSQIAYFLSNVKAKTLEQKKAKEELMKIYKDTTLDAKGRYMPKPPFKLLGVGFGRTRVKQGGKQEYGYIQVGGTKFYTDVPSLHLKQKEETKSTGLRLGVFGELGAGVKQ